MIIRMSCFLLCCFLFFACNPSSSNNSKNGIGETRAGNDNSKQDLPQQTERELFGYKDKVKTVRIASYSASGLANDVKQEELNQLQTMAFNEAGFIVLDSQEEKSYNDIPSPGINQFFYNKYGKIDSSLFLLSDGTVYDRELYTYNEKGQKIEKILIQPDFFEKEVSKYDDKGNLTAEIYYDKVGNILEKFTYKYDGKGNQIERAYYNSYGDLEEKYTYQYDEKGRIIKYVEYQGDYPTMSKVLKYNGNTLKEEVHSNEGQLEKLIKYNDVGNLSEIIFYDWDGEIKDRHETHYNKQGQKSLEKSYLGAKQLESEKGYTYDNKGNIVEEYWVDHQSNRKGKNSTIYTYDKKGNWIKAIFFEEGNASSIQEREISYFE